MKALILLLLSLSAFSQEFLQCEFEIRDNETEIEELEESKANFLLKLHETESVKHQFKLYKIRINSSDNSKYEHQILAFDIDAENGFSKILKDKEIPFELVDTGNTLTIDVNRIYQNMNVNIRTDFNYWNFAMGGPYTQKITHKFNSLTPLYTEVYFEKVKKKLFGKNQNTVEREVVPIYFSCQKLDTSFVIQTELNDKTNMIYSPLDEAGSAKAMKN